MIVYDISDHDYFNGVESWMHEIDKWASPQVNKILIGNKSDKESDRKVTFDEGSNLAKHYGIPFLEVSAKNGTNISSCFKLMTSEIHKRIAKSGPPVTPGNKLGKNQEFKSVDEKKSSCCK